MIKKIILLIKKLIISAFILYGYNLIASPINVYIPINIITILALTFLGYPALFSLILINIIIY